ncbi:MAG: 3-dehydroquinate synthase [Thermoplasmata archaeon]|uniref:3-dehydroquinate synthase n=1 Tax=Candidatus Sysuiplasma superficiale TaxID=2823368 RepID=A0A8J8CCZ7_9ARCH|nr:3-dehydroquinate synthase II [Candidatus Sysuiplasma superficiale]MBX8643840.1 3-dehydroquinate synthase [Candidatus Sysuiplasma superficiale]
MTVAEDKFIWIRINDSDARSRRRLAIEAVELGFEDLVLPAEDAEMQGSLRFNHIEIEGDSVISGGARIGTFVDIAGEDDMPDESSMKYGLLVVRVNDWKVIPVENLIATCSHSGTRLVACTSDVEEATLFLNTLERGVDGILADVSGRNQLVALQELMRSKNTVYALQEGEITGIRSAGMGDRVCIDTCSLLSKGEGMLVGSQSSFLFLVHSESLESKYVNPRPFRVNAGPVHSYILGEKGRTKYLSEIRAGDRIPAVSQDGTSRYVTVGRAKIERRPLLLLEANVGGEECSIILQNAETVNLCTPTGTIPVTSLKKGDRVLVHTQKGGRHFGVSVRETVFER